MQQRILLCTFFLLFDYLLVHLHVRGAYLETETNDQYQGAIVVFNFTDRHMKVVLVSGGSLCYDIKRYFFFFLQNQVLDLLSHYLFYRVSSRQFLRIDH